MVDVCYTFLYTCETGHIEPSVLLSLSASCICTVSLILYPMVLKMFPRAVGYGHLGIYF